MNRQSIENLIKELNLTYNELQKYSFPQEALNEFQGIIKNLNSPITLMITGAFSTGKSSLINALLGSELTAVSSNPTTAVITKLCYGLEDGIFAHYKNKSVKKITADDFFKLTADLEQGIYEETHNSIDFVERQIPLEVLKFVTIIDSPGLNDINTKHSEVTEKFVQNADVMLWLFSSVQACSNLEVAYISRLALKAKPIVVVNKMDLIDEEEDDPEEFLDNIKKMLKDRVQDVIGVSAKYALEGELENNPLKKEIGNLSALEQIIEKNIILNKNEYKMFSFLDEFSTFVFNTVETVKSEEIGNEFDYCKKYREKIINLFRNVMIIVRDNLNIIIEKDNAQMLFLMGCMYELGWEYNSNANAAEKLYYKAAQKNHLLSQIKLMTIYRNTGRLEEMFDMLSRAASLGDADCKYWLGLCYEFGEGTNIDENKAFQCYKEASEYGCTEVYYSLGMCYLNGIGVIPNEKEALEYLEKASANRNYSAAYELGIIYQNGEVVAKNLNKAFKYFLMASESGEEEPALALAECYLNGWGTSKNKNEAMKYLKIAVAYGNSQAQYELAKCLMEE